ncbi:10433_t:CDS:2 [Entrophospora sp. SA101]|nr:10433_t:CDS:2 [Entrophospora sp. SA101]
MYGGRPDYEHSFFHPKSRWLEHSGDGGIDLIGAFVYEGERYVLVVQCKHCKTFSIAVCELKGVMAVYPYYTSIGILVINSEHQISNQMRTEANSQTFKRKRGFEGKVGEEEEDDFKDNNFKECDNDSEGDDDSEVVEGVEH